MKKYISTLMRPTCALKVSQLITYITAPNNETFKTSKKKSKTHNKKTQI